VQRVNDMLAVCQQIRAKYSGGLMSIASALSSCSARLNFEWNKNFLACHVS